VSNKTCGCSVAASPPCGRTNTRRLDSSHWFRIRIFPQIIICFTQIFPCYPHIISNQTTFYRLLFYSHRTYYFCSFFCQSCRTMFFSVVLSCPLASESTERESGLIPTPKAGAWFSGMGPPGERLGFVGEFLCFISPQNLKFSATKKGTHKVNLLPVGSEVVGIL